MLISVTVTGCDKDSVSSSGQIRIGQDYWNTGGAYVMPGISSCSIVVYSEGHRKPGRDLLPASICLPTRFFRNTATFQSEHSALESNSMPCSQLGKALMTRIPTTIRPRVL